MNQIWLFQPASHSFELPFSCILHLQKLTLFFTVFEKTAGSWSQTTIIKLFEVTITACPLIAQRLNIYHCCEHRCVLKPVVGVEFFLVDRI